MMKTAIIQRQNLLVILGYIVWKRWPKLNPYFFWPPLRKSDCYKFTWFVNPIGCFDNESPPFFKLVNELNQRECNMV